MTNQVINSYAVANRPRFDGVPPIKMQWRDTKIDENPSTGAVYSRIGNHDWCGGCVGQDGHIYFAPDGEDKILTVNTDTGKAFTWGNLGFAGTWKWISAVPHPNGKIYFIPHQYSNVLEVDPINKTYTEPFDPLYSGPSFKYAGGVLAPNNQCIYCIPNYVDKVAKIDPQNKTFTEIGTASGDIGIVPDPANNEGGSNKFCTGVLGNDGMIYMIGAYYKGVAKIDPFTDTVTWNHYTYGESELVGCVNPNGGGGSDNVSYMFDNAIAWGAGKIICLPDKYPFVCVYDYVNNTIARMNNTPFGSINGNDPPQSSSDWVDDQRHGGSCLAADNKIYCGPSGAGSYSGAENGSYEGVHRHEIMVVDPFLGTCTATPIKDGYEADNNVGAQTYLDHYGAPPYYVVGLYSAVLGPDGNIYCGPYFASGLNGVFTMGPNSAAAPAPHMIGPYQNTL